MICLFYIGLVFSGLDTPGPPAGSAGFRGGAPAPFPILNPNLMALTMAEAVGRLRQKGAYQISRLAYYAQPPDQHFKAVTEQTRQAWHDARPSLLKTYG